MLSSAVTLLSLRWWNQGNKGVVLQIFTVSSCKQVEPRCRFSNKTLQLPRATNCCPRFADCSLAVLDWPANWPEVNRDAPIKNTDELTAAF